MAGEGSKISFSFGGAATSAPAAPASLSGGLSNMERLLAQAKTNKPPAAKSKPAVKKPNFFGDDEDDESFATAKPARSSLSGPSQVKSAKPATQQSSLLSRSERKAQEQALKIDASVFDYDGVYDGMKAAERKTVEAKKAEDAERKPKYIESFLKSAQTRRLDRLRAEEKMLQLEREKEGDEFADKEKFVTEAYKKQMEEVRKAEAEEKEREEALRNSKKGPGLTSFYKSMLDDDAEKHAAAVAAANGNVASGPSLAIRPPTTRDEAEQYEPEDEYDPFLARQAKDESKNAGSSRLSGDTGKQVDINDEGEVVDKRSLLKAGLNIMNRPKSQLPTSLLSSQKSASVLEGPFKSRAVGTSASYQERMERERKRLADQMREEAEKKRLAEESRLREEEEAARRRREDDDGEAQRKRQQAKQRFLERKRQREEAEKEAKKKKKLEAEGNA